MSEARENLEILSRVASKSRAAAVLTAYRCGDAHLSSTLSCIEAFTAILCRVHLEGEKGINLVLSKGHAVLAYYAVLSQLGVINTSELLSFNHENSRLQNHPNAQMFPYVELSSGSLGMGLGFGTGLALGKKLAEEEGKVFVILGDGECNEGSIWEAAMFAGAQQLSNITAIIDHNKIQAVATYKDVSANQRLSEKFKSFGWDVIEVNGNSISEIVFALNECSEKPLAVISHTSGSNYFPHSEDSVLWHYRRPDDEDLKAFAKKLRFDDFPDLVEMFL